MCFKEMKGGAICAKGSLRVGQIVFDTQEEAVAAVTVMSARGCKGHLVTVA
jgi:hypothetical protein